MDPYFHSPLCLYFLVLGLDSFASFIIIDAEYVFFTIKILLNLILKK